jgi:hypothetical protein
MTRRKYPTRLSNREPLCWLADAWAKTHCGSKSLAFLADATGPRPMPWALSSDGNYVVELWSTLHRIHRRKNGFTHVVEHLSRIEDSVMSLSGCERPVFEVWEEPNGDPLDAKLVQQWADRIRSSLHTITTADLAIRLQKIQRLESLPEREEHNPLLQCESLKRSLIK